VTPVKRTTVLLADDHTIVREGFRRMLELEDDLEVVGEAQDGRQAVALVKKLHPNVVLMDIAMPLLNGLEAARQVLKISLKPKCSCSLRTTTTPMLRLRLIPARLDIC
jgi:YesN/AraC family two-component response regulator